MNRASEVDTGKRKGQGTSGGHDGKDQRIGHESGPSFNPNPPAVKNVAGKPPQRSKRVRIQTEFPQLGGQPVSAFPFR
jgi:hypothetical protein